MEPTLTPVESSNLSAIGFDTLSNTLRVQFKNGGVYDYDGVPAEVYNQLLTAESVGSTFHKLVKLGGYTFHKVELNVPPN